MFQLSGELGQTIVPKATLTFSKCLEMKLDEHIDIIAKVGEVAGKEYAIEEVCLYNHVYLLSMRVCFFS